jgi:monothiol glutaredoxin
MPDAHSRIAEIVQTNPVVLFMKGTPLFPQCGFSSRAVAILDHLGVTYECVDVLQDMEIRQGIKEYSDWPTIPQLYVGGEFVGGSDIMMEMFEASELQDLFKAGCRGLRRTSTASSRGRWQAAPGRALNSAWR